VSWCWDEWVHQQAGSLTKGLAWNTGAALLGDLALQLETASPADAKRIAQELSPLRQRTVAALVARTMSLVDT
jgi:hypothetical protein